MIIKTYAAVMSGTPIDKVVELHKERQQQMFPVVEERTGKYLGYITYGDVQKYQSGHPDATLITSGGILREASSADRLVHAHINESPEEALRKIRTHRLEFLPVVDTDGNYKGTVDDISILTLL